MKIKLIKRQILDEREEQLVNKAGMESFSLMLYGGFALYMGSVAMNAGAVHYQPFLLLILIASFYFMCRTQYLGANYYNSFSLTIWGCAGCDRLSDSFDWLPEFPAQSCYLS